ncbi:MAG: hypothetical protein BWY73_01655 [candidate division TA06 bacterium ADurb.Bin417]|uniref:Uncharacterized protein n=1 Tax=candidate division TA06 bacterium ADurb.Bin417 TaxID=1852828 RepID=A0A1V5M5L2_UNCT6|nr:MAG: hypothetical protein BWY73_01655 [candidate division TA06 bacterium ADurb.Bin417]
MAEDRLEAGVADRRQRIEIGDQVPELRVAGGAVFRRPALGPPGRDRGIERHAAVGKVQPDGPTGPGRRGDGFGEVLAEGGQFRVRGQHAAGFDRLPVHVGEQVAEFQPVHPEGAEGRFPQLGEEGGDQPVFHVGLEVGGGVDPVGRRVGGHGQADRVGAARRSREIEPAGCVVVDRVGDRQGPGGGRAGGLFRDAHRDQAGADGLVRVAGQDEDDVHPPGPELVEGGGQRGAAGLENEGAAAAAAVAFRIVGELVGRDAGPGFGLHLPHQVKRTVGDVVRVPPGADEAGKEAEDDGEEQEPAFHG